MVGDEIVIRPGEKIPLMAVPSGQSAVDESMVTGESMPVTKRHVTRSSVRRSTPLDRYECVQPRSARTMLAQIVRMVQQAQASRAPIQRQMDLSVLRPGCDRNRDSYVRGVVRNRSGAALTLALVSAVAVLIIACPCALGLATLSIMVGTGKGARSHFDPPWKRWRRRTSLTPSCLDKTGTITAGKPVLTDVCVVGTMPEDEL